MENVNKAITNSVSITDVTKNVSKYLTSIKDGPKVVFKNNRPESVIMSARDYSEMIQKLEALNDYVMTVERLESNQKVLSDEEFWKEFNISDEEILSVGDVEFE